MTALAKETRNQSIEEMFIQQMEDIYYPGYSEEMTREQAIRYEWELKEFQSPRLSMLSGAARACLACRRCRCWCREERTRTTSWRLSAPTYEKAV